MTLSMQDVFNKVWNHFVVNDGPLSFVNSGTGVSCRYRGPNNSKCAIGVILPDEMYKSEMEDKTAARMLAEHPDFAALFDIRPEEILMDNVFVHFLTNLQEAHDYTAMHGTKAQSLEEGFRKVAGDFRLIIPA